MRRDLTKPADEVEVLGEVTRLVVAQLHDAQDVPARHERHGELRLVPPLLERVAALLIEERIVQRSGHGDLAGLHGATAARVAAQRQHHAVPLGVEPAAVVAHQRAKRVALHRIDVGDRRVRELREAFGHGVEDLVRAEAGGVFEARLDDQGEVSIAALQARDHVTAAERDRQEVGGDLGDVLGRGQPLTCGGAELEHSHEAIPEDDGGEDDAGESSACQEALRRLGRHLRRAGVRGDHERCAACDRQAGGGVVAQAPLPAVVDGVASHVAGGERAGDCAGDPVHGAGVEVGTRAQRLQCRQHQRLGVHRRRAHAEPGDQVIQVGDPASEHGWVEVSGQRKGGRCRHRVHECSLFLVRRPPSLAAVHLDESRRGVAEVDGRGVQALGSALLATDEVRAGDVEPGQVRERDRLAGEEGRGRGAEVGGRVQQAAQRGRITSRRRRDRLERIGVAVVPEDVAGHGAQLVAQAIGEGDKQVLGPLSESCPARHRLLSQAGLRLRVPGVFTVRQQTRGVARHEFSERDIRAGERARRARFHELQDGLVAAVDRERHRQDGRVAALAQQLSLAALEQVRRRQVGDHDPAAGTEHLSDGGQRLAGDFFLEVRPALTRPAVCAEDAEASAPVGQREPALRHADAFGGHAGQREQGRAQRIVVGRGPRAGGGPSLLVAGALFGAQQPLYVGAPVPPVAAGAAVAREPAGVAPPSQRVEAHAQLRRGFAEAEPAFSVCSSYAHI